MPFSVAAKSVILGRGFEGCAWGQVTEAMNFAAKGSCGHGLKGLYVRERTALGSCLEGALRAPWP